MRDHNCESGGTEQLQGEDGCTLPKSFFSFFCSVSPSLFCFSVSFLSYQSHMLSSLLRCVYIHGKKFKWR